MGNLTKVLVRCKIHPGGFSGERVFEVTMAAGNEYCGVSPLAYCRDEAVEPVRDGVPAPGTEIVGYVEALSIKTVRGNTFVEFPDGQAVLIPSEQVTHRLETRNEYVRREMEV